MKKTIIGLSGLIVLTFFVIFAVNAQNNHKEVGKSGTEVSQSISKCIATASCSGLSGSKMANCCGGNSSAMNCDAAKCKAGKCDPATCKRGNCDPATCNGGKCDQATCKTNCSGASTGMLSGPMNCNR